MAVFDKTKMISAKDLGRLNLPEFCQRCFWLERYIGKPPAVFPGIFSAIDSVTKKGVARAFLETGAAPAWLPLDSLAEIADGSLYFKLPIADGAWVVIGTPDDIFTRADGTYHIVDYKTAKFTERQDALLPLYEVQLNCYVMLAEEYGIKPVSRLSLVYFEPNVEAERGDAFHLGFQTTALEVAIDREIVPRLLSKARKIVDEPRPPLAREGCKGTCHFASIVTSRCRS